MSLLWRDEVAIYLAPHRLALVRRARGLRPRVVAAAEIPVSAIAAGDLDAVLALLAEALTEPKWHDAAARVVVADHRWARYGVIPWPATRLDAAGRLAQARYLLGDTYGEAVADWDVTLSEAPPGQSAIACAMPAKLGKLLREALAPARLKLVSLQPRLIVAFNAWRHRLPADDSWFVSLDDGLLSAVQLSNGAWAKVHMARLSLDWSVELERIEAFGRLTRAQGATSRIFVDAPARMRGSSSAGLEWLEADDGDGAKAHEIALLRRIST